MARKRADDDATVVNIDPETGEPTLFLGGPAAPGGMGSEETDAEKRTQDMYWRLLGNDRDGTGFVTVHYLPQGRSQTTGEVSCGRYPADKYDYDELLEVIRNTAAVRLHPGKEGDYRVRMFIKGQRGCVGNKLESLLAPEPGTAQAMIPAGNNGMDAMLALVREMRADSLRAQEQMTALARERGQGGQSFGETMIALAPVLTPLLVAWMNKPKDDPMQSLTAALALIGQIREMREDVQAIPAASDGTPWWAGAVMMALDKLPALAEARAAHTAHAPMLAGPGAVAPAAAPAPTIRHNPDSPGNTSHPFYGQIAGFVAVQDESDPAEVAQHIWSQLEPAKRGVVLQFLTAPGAYRKIAAIHPGVLDNPGWWADLQDALLDLAERDANTAPDTAATVASDAGGQDHVIVAPVGD